MTTRRKWIFWTTGALLLAIVASLMVVENRGGHYPVYQASSFSHLSLPAASTPPADEPLVQIDAGTLRGATVRSVIAFRGIPYARPPVGELRWQPPQPPPPWQGVRDAQQPGRACTQRVSGLVPFFAPMAQAYGSNFEQPPIKSSEDCLYLDVWVTSPPRPRTVGCSRCRRSKPFSPERSKRWIC